MWPLCLEIITLAWNFRSSLCLYLTNIPLCGNTTMYPLTSQQTLGLFPLLCSKNEDTIKIHIQVFGGNILSFFLHKYLNGTAGL